MTPAGQGSRERIQAEKPSSRSGIQAEEPIPPWEHAGCFRRDCQPHHATTLQVLAGGAMVVSAGCLLISAVTFGILRSYAEIAVWLLACSFAAFGMGVWVCMLARFDLAEMERGQMDPAGQVGTRRARSTARLAIFLALLFVWLVVSSGRL